MVCNLQYATDLELSKKDPFKLKFVIAYLRTGQKVLKGGVEQRGGESSVFEPLVMVVFSYP